MQRIVRHLAGLVLFAVGSAALAQQSADADYHPAIATVAPAPDAPVVVIDQAHGNFHQLDGRYAPFAALARHGGFRVLASNTAFNAAHLRDVDVLVVANASSEDDGSAFSEPEITALVDWVSQGGSLLLIADHAPFGSAAMDLAQRFGVDMGNGYVVVGERSSPEGTIDFDADAGGDHPVLDNPAPGRRIGNVRAFLGQSLGVPMGATVLLQLPTGAVELADGEVAAEYVAGRADGVDVSSRAQAIAMPYGAGRLVISGEAAMFTSQVADDDGVEVRVGLGDLDNEAYVLNVLDWLARRI